MKAITGFLIGFCLCFLIVLIEELVRTKQWNEKIWRYFIMFGILVNLCSVLQVFMLVNGI